MSEFVFNDEHAAYEAAVSALARREFMSTYLERASRDDMPWAELKRLAHHNLLDLGVPEEFGGQDADPITIGIACEQVAYADFNLSYLVFGANAGLGEILGGLPRHIAQRLATAVASGDEVWGLALTEPRGGSDAARPTVRAEQVDGGFLLTGEKTSVTLGMHSREILVVATTDPSAGSRATRRFLVPADDPTITRQQFRDPGFRPLGRAGIAFDGTFVPDEREVVAQAGSGRSGIAEQLAAFDFTRILLGLMVIGAARRALDMTVQWVKDREAFGRPIAGFQGVSFTIAEHDTKLEAARWLCYRALGLRAQGLRHTREAAMCKWWAPRLAVEAINDCIVLHGHVGWSLEMPLQQMLLDVSGLQIGDGTPQIQKLVIARELIGREFVG